MSSHVVVNTAELGMLLADAGFLVGALSAYADEHGDKERAAKATAWTTAARALLDTAIPVERVNKGALEYFADVLPLPTTWREVVR